MIKDFFAKNGFGNVNVYQNYDQVNYFVVFQKSEKAIDFKRLLEDSKGLKKSCFCKILLMIQWFFLVLIDDITVFLEDYDDFLRKKERLFTSKLW